MTLRAKVSAWNARGVRLTHLTPEKFAALIRRNGIAARSRNGWNQRGVYAMPIGPDFMASHQWLRELRRKGQRTFVAIDFTIPDDELVWVGHYSAPHVELPAAAAANLIHQAESPLGYEIVVSRRVTPNEISRVRSVPQVVGWRYHPDAHGQTPCGCRACVPGGRFGDRKLRDRYEAGLR